MNFLQYQRYPGTSRPNVLVKAYVLSSDLPELVDFPPPLIEEYAQAFSTCIQLSAELFSEQTYTVRSGLKKKKTSCKVTVSMNTNETLDSKTVENIQKVAGVDSD